MATAAALLLIPACTSDNDPQASPQPAGTPASPSEHDTTTGETSAPPETPPATPAEPRSVTVVLNGDMLLHEGLWATAEIDARRTGRGTMDFRPLMADMRPVVKGADLAICHMETPFAPRGGPYAGYPLFAAPPAFASALKWMGFDACTTASNHSIDQGFDGLEHTLDVFDRVGIAHTGTARTKADSREPLLMDVNGVTVGLVAATYGTNGLPLPEDEPWSVHLINTTKIERMAARARAAGADIVMVALHWGLEYTNDPTEDQLAVANELTQSPDIDLIYGHHAHVVQPYDKVHRAWVLYGLGNAIAQQSTEATGLYDGNTARVTFTERDNGAFAVTKLEYIPTMITEFDYVHPMRWLNVPRSLDDPDYAALRDDLRATEGRVTEIVGRLGAFKRGVVEGE